MWLHRYLMVTWAETSRGIESMNNHHLRGSQIILIALTVGGLWGLVIAGIGILGLVKTGNQPGDAQAMTKIVIVEALFAVGGTAYFCLKHFRRRL